jgi:uncharacterized protein YecE (DUF72 family)
MPVVRVRVGTSGWTYPDWAGRFYPPEVPRRAWLSYYASQFSTVEVNGTFYRLPTRSATTAWREQVGDDFRFVVKGSRYLTHLRKLLDTTTGVERFYEGLAPLGSALDTVLWQLPPTLGLDVARLDRFLTALPATTRHAVEFRHPSWLVDEAYAVLEAHQAMVVNVSGPQLRVDHRVTGGAVYVRFHGLTAGYAYDYTDPDLAPWVGFLRGRPDGFAFFNNDVGGHAVANARRLVELLSA